MGVLSDMKVKLTGMDAVQRTFKDLEANLNYAMGSALFVGARVMVDEVNAGLQALPVQENKAGHAPYVKPGKKLHGITSSQKSDLIGALGIAQFKETNGTLNTSVGFDGYCSDSYWHDGEKLPVQVLMREVESGTSWMDKHPVVRPAVNRAKKKMIDIMDKKFKEKEIKDNG